MATLHVNIVTPSEDFLHGDVDMVTAPSVLGEVGILPGHLPLLADLHEGPLGLWKGTDVQQYAVSDGFIEVDADTVTVLAETCEKSVNIDVKRSERALKDAQKKLKKLDIADPDYAEQIARIRRARIRLHVAGKDKK